VSAGLRSGQLAQAAGVKIETLRYYERRGLLAEPERTLGGHRVYSAEAIAVLRVIKAAQRLGFTLEEVAELLQVSQRRHRVGAADAGLQARARTKLAELHLVRDTLRSALNAGCDDLIECANNDCCPIPFVQLTDPPGRSDGC
jgi:MerR family transcriptional regulator, mercuric resistance operon regulatory protein